MTRAERLAEQAARTKTRLNDQRAKLAKVQSALHAEGQKALTKRRYAVGTLVLELPLGSLDDATLGQLFAVLSRLAMTPDPVACLAALLGTAEAVPGNDESSS